MERGKIKITVTSHYLDPLLKPKSIALVGASNREGSPGRVLAELVINSSFQGNIYPVNPGYDSLLGIPCFPNLTVLPEKVEHAVLAVSNERLEQTLIDAIEHGIRGATIFSSCVLEHDCAPLLKDRIAARAVQAGVAICGGNGMGFYSITHGLYAGVFPMPGEMPRGGISFIAQSGSALSALAHNGCRLRFNLCVSSGNEMVTTASDYMDWSLAQSSTRVIALFLESVRDSSGFVRALGKAQQLGIPVVVMKVGRSSLSAEMAQTHTGALAGNHTAYRAVFDHYNVFEVNDFGEMAATLMMFQSQRRAGIGDLATIQESGGLMELVTDIAEDFGISYASISDDTKSELQMHLEPGLKADNPLDAWGSNEDFENRFHRCMSALMADPSVSIGIFFANFRDGYYLSEAFVRMMEKVSLETDKPIALVNCYTDVANDNLCKRTSDAGIPFIDGTKEALLAVKHMIEFRDMQITPSVDDTRFALDSSMIEKWQDYLGDKRGCSLSEGEALSLFSDFGITTPDSRLADNLQQVKTMGIEMGFPLVLKTAATGIAHKSDQGGVIVNIADIGQLIDSYHALSKALGPEVAVSSMIDQGTEMGLGIINDPQFGPFVMLAAGGILIELLSDSTVALAPVSSEKASQMITSLKINKMLDGWRGMPPGNRLSLVESIVRLSSLAYALRDYISEIDINPIIVNQTGAHAVDGLVVVR